MILLFCRSLGNLLSWFAHTFCLDSFTHCNFAVDLLLETHSQENTRGLVGNVLTHSVTSSIPTHNHMHFFLSLRYFSDASGNENKPWHGQQHEGAATGCTLILWGSRNGENIQFPPDYGWFRMCFLARSLSILASKFSLTAHIDCTYHCCHGIHRGVIHLRAQHAREQHCSALGCN